MRVPKALTIAGSDSGGGAGIQADLKTFSAFRVFGMSVLTAVTAQNSLGVQGVFTSLPPTFVGQQLDAVLADFGADAVKIGMLSTAPIIGAVAAACGRTAQDRVVLDPVMIAKSGDPLLQPDARAALIEKMLPLAAVVTPNLHEAAALADMPVDTEADMAEAARRILGPRGPRVLVKGGHLKDSRHRRPLGRPHAHALSRTAGRLAQHPRHRLHALLGHRGRPRPRPLARGRRARGQGVRDGGDPRGLRGRAAAWARSGTSCDAGRPMGRLVDDKMSFMEHLGELRTRIVRSLIALLIGLGISFPFGPRVIEFLARPVKATGNKLVFIAPTEAFWTQMKVALICGFFLASPGILWQVWKFVAPGLYARAREEVRGALRDHRLAAVHRRRAPSPCSS